MKQSVRFQLQHYFPKYIFQTFLYFILRYSFEESCFQTLSTVIIIFGCNKVLTDYVYGEPQNPKFPTEDLFFNVNEIMLREEGKYFG